MALDRTNWMRNKEGAGLWEHRGKVAIAGWGTSPMDRRWDGSSLDKTMGAYTMIAVKNAIEDAGLTLDDVDGIICSKDTRVGDTWAPRPFFPPPYDTEDGITFVSAEWLNKQMGFKNVKYLESEAGAMAAVMGHAAQAVGEGLAQVLVAYYPMGNIEGRYEMGGQNATDYARGGTAFQTPWGYQSGAQMNALLVFEEYCRKYNYPTDGILAPFAVNQRRNGLMTPWGFYAQHEPYQITIEDYMACRYVSEPLRVFDCDRPVISCSAFIFTTADRAKDMKQPPVYVLSHSTGNERDRSTMGVLSEHQYTCSKGARVLYEGSGLTAADVDIFNPYDGYLTFTHQFTEAFEWHGIKEGEALDFYKGDLRVEGPHPYLSSGGNNGTGRTRTALMIDSIEQLRGQAPNGRQVQIRHETAVFGALVPGSATFLAVSSQPV